MNDKELNRRFDQLDTRVEESTAQILRMLAIETRPQGNNFSPSFSAAFDPRASLEDIYACFRLLLGRNHSREHWVGHSALAGGPLDKVVHRPVSSL